MATIIRMMNRNTGEVFVFAADSWVEGVNVAQKRLYDRNFPNIEIQADFDDGHSFDYHNMELVEGDGEKEVAGYTELYGRNAERYLAGKNMPSMGQLRELSRAAADALASNGPDRIAELEARVAELESQLAVAGGELEKPYLMQIDPDSGEIVANWPDAGKAALVHGVKTDNLLEVIESGVIKYGFLWRMEE